MLPSEDHLAAGHIYELYHERKLGRASIFNTMDDIRRHYHGEVMVPLPELDDQERPAVANLIYQGIEQFSLRAASTTPDVKFPPLRPGIDVSEKKARNRRLASLGWLDMNKTDHKLRRRFRHLVSYGATVCVMSPVPLNHHDKRRIPFWQVRDPLGTFPAPMVDPDDVHPHDCIFVTTKSFGWLKRNFPSQAMSILRDHDCADSKEFDVVEYMDKHETATIVIGSQRKPNADPYYGRGVPMQDGVSSHLMLTRIPNHAGITPVTYAGRIGLDRQTGMFDQMRGFYQRAAKLDALQTIAVFRNVFPDEWVESMPNAQNSKAKIVREADGRIGERGIIENGRLNVVHLQPGSTSSETLSNLERSGRLTVSLPAELGGESGTNIRTARRGESVLSSSIDMPLAELQDIMAAALETEIQIGVAIMNGYYPTEPKSFYMGTKGDVISNDYVPARDFETDICAVSYSMPGADINGMVVATGQMVGTEIMSKRTAMEMNPWVEDPRREEDQIELEGLRRATLAGMEQQATQGQLDPLVVARVAKIKAEQHLPIEQALLIVHKEQQEEQAKQQQAQQAQPGQPGLQQGEQGEQGEQPALPPGAAEQMPGVQRDPNAPNPDPMQALGPGGEPSVQPPSGGEQNLSSLLAALRRPERTSPQESALASPAAGPM